MTTYTTSDEAIAEIITAIEASNEVTDARAEYDIDAIADEVLTLTADGYCIDTDIFWVSVERNAKPMGRDLYDYNTGELIGPATAEQIAASEAAGDAGVITIDADLVELVGVITIDASTGEVLHNGADKAVWPNQRDVYVA